MRLIPTKSSHKMLFRVCNNLGGYTDTFTGVTLDLEQDRGATDWQDVAQGKKGKKEKLTTEYRYLYLGKMACTPSADRTSI
jgi:hypothetical protein